MENQYRINFEPNDTVPNPLSKSFIKITPKEAIVLRELCTDMSYKEIGYKLNLSRRTIEAYKNNLCEKIGVKTRVGLVVFALQKIIFLDK